jgi:purine-nucleoside phosphorylase
VTREPDGVTDEVGAAAAALRRAAPVPPLTAVILGSGLAGIGGLVSDAVTMPAHEIPHWPRPAVAGHSGACVLGRVGARPVVVVAGRVHLYEGMGIGAVTFAVRVLARLGVRELILTNAAGGIAHGLVPGTLMAIDDHIGLLVPNPLVGPNDDRLGPRFPDMTATYSPRLRALADTVAREAGLALAHGVYVAVTGPSYETPADVRALRALGADAVGASTVPEAIVARHLGLEVLGLSVIANRAAGDRSATRRCCVTCRAPTTGWRCCWGASWHGCEEALLARARLHGSAVGPMRHYRRLRRRASKGRGRRSESAMSRGAARPAARSRRRDGANSQSTWRQAPQGVTGHPPVATMAIRRNRRCPAARAAKRATRSAHMVRP